MAEEPTTKRSGSWARDPELRVVAADDDVAIGQLIEICLRKEGIVCKVVQSPFALGAALAEVKPTVVLMDVNMPAIAGPELWSIARANLDPIPAIVFVSAAPESTRQALLSRFPEASYLSKPFRPSDLVLAVREAHARGPDGRASVG